MAKFKILMLLLKNNKYATSMHAFSLVTDSSMIPNDDNKDLVVVKDMFNFCVVSAR